MKISEALFSGSSTRISEKPKQKFPEFAFIGRSNVGKSSLINMLCNNKKLAMTSSKPGKTRLVNHFLINREWYLVDLPGYGYAKVNDAEKLRWSELMEGYFKSNRNIKMVFSLIDMRHPATDFDLWMLDFLAQIGLPYTVVLTKSDKLNKTETQNRLTLIKEELGDFAQGCEIIPFSAQTGFGADKIKEIIENLRG